MTPDYDIAIIGAGAAGLATAIFAAETARAHTLMPRIALLDSAKKIGAKILVSGGGRCNVTHNEIHPEDFNGSRNIVRNVLAAFDEKATVRWFASLGVPLKCEETGKLFPISDSARSVLDALLRRCDELEVVILTQHRVTDVYSPSHSSSLLQDPSREIPPALPFSQGETEKSPSAKPVLSPGEGEAAQSAGESGRAAVKRMVCTSSTPQEKREPETISQESLFTVHHERGEFHARQVVLATGGRSLPKTGSDGSGWEIARRLGHSVSTTVPALVPLVLHDSMFHVELSGISLPVELATFADGKVVDRRTGSLLWTHFGISGPVVMDASRHWALAHAKGHQVELRGNFLPGQRFEEVEAWFVATAKARPRVSVGKVLAERLPDRLAAALIRESEFEPHVLLSQLSRTQRRTLVHKLTAFAFPVARDRGWNFAEVTAGGIPLAEIDYRTMESRKQKGLYLVGEMLDCDGRIGGFNFQWAWATGYLAGRAVGGRVRVDIHAS